MPTSISSKSWSSFIALTVVVVVGSSTTDLLESVDCLLKDCVCYFNYEGTSRHGAFVYRLTSDLKKIKSDGIRLSAVRMILTHAKHNSPYLASSFSLSYHVQLKSEDLSHSSWKLRGTQQQFSENIFSEDDLRPRIFGTFVLKFPACLPLLGFSNI